MQPVQAGERAEGEENYEFCSRGRDTCKVPIRKLQGGDAKEAILYESPVLRAKFKAGETNTGDSNLMDGI